MPSICLASMYYYFLFSRKAPTPSTALSSSSPSATTVRLVPFTRGRLIMPIILLALIFVFSISIYTLLLYWLAS